MKSIIKKVAVIAVTAIFALGMAGCNPNVDTHKHTWDEGEVTTSPTCVTKGVKNYKCTVCEETKTEEIPELYSLPVDFVTGEAATADSEYVLFGVFPKTVLPLNSTVTVDETDSVTMGANSYYKGSDGEYYAKALEDVYAFKYTDGTQGSTGSYRYFRVEPIKWKVLTADYDGKQNALLLAEDILTANVPYYEDYENNRTIDGETVYSNNYQHSQIRAYLNGLTYQGQSGEVAKWKGNGFLQTAFTEAAQGKIVTTTVDNSGASTTDETGSLTKADGSNSSYPDYTCADTADKIFLLSEKEVTIKGYGFAAHDSYGKGNARIRMPTDYAKANCAFQQSTDGGGNWWLRSPDYTASRFASCVRYDGRDICGNVDYTVYGVVPALSILLQ